MAKSTELLNAIRTEASAEYIARVPLATQDNLAEIGATIIEYEPFRNEFAHALFGKIAKTYIEIKEYQNPLQALKRGQLGLGMDIEEIFIDLVMSEVFNAELSESTLFKRELPKVLASYHRLNRQEVYTTTVEDVQLSLAFQSEESFGTMVEGIISRLYTSDQYDEFLLMKGLLNVAGTEGKFALKKVLPVSDEATARQALVGIKQISNDMTFMKTIYNFAGVRTHTPKADQVILINSSFDALLNVEVLAYAFNMSKADFETQSILVDDFGGLENVLCIVMDKKWYMVEDKENRTTSQYNPKGLYTNYFLHRWQVLSSSPFKNAVAIITVDATLASIDVLRFDARTTYTPMEIFQIYVEATGSTDPYPPSKASFTHNGLSAKTYISTTGLVVIGDDETQDPLVITATSTFDGAISDTLSLAKA